MKRYRGQGPEQRSFCPPGAWGQPQGSVLVPQHEALKRVKKLSFFGFLWRLHYINHCQWLLIQPEALLPSLEIKVWD